MKKILIAIAALVSFTSHGQGTFIFNNRDIGNGIDAKVVDFTGVGLGAGWTAQMWLIAGTSITPLTPTTTFRTGAAAGYVNPLSDPVVVPGVSGGSVATLRMVAFNGAAYASSAYRGQSAAFTITLGGGGTPPTVPSPLIGLTGFSLLPEPSTIALSAIGVAAQFIRCGRKNVFGC